MRNPRRNRGTEIGVLLLISHLINNGMIPPVTLGTVILQILIYIDVIILPFKLKERCISGANILFKKKYSLLITSALEHADDMHLYYNMTSFTLKGRYLEKKYGSINFALLLIVLILMSSSFYVFNSYVLYLFYEEDYSELLQCAVGFSGVLFALKTIMTREKSSECYSVLGLCLPAWAAAWAELILISIMVPNASFRGHLSGIFAGLIYTDTPIGSFIDTVFYVLSGQKVYHNFSRRPIWRLIFPFSCRPGSGRSSPNTGYQSGRPPRYGFVYGNSDDWEYDYYER